MQHICFVCNMLLCNDPVTQPLSTGVTLVIVVLCLHNIKILKRTVLSIVPSLKKKLTHFVTANKIKKISL